MQIGIELPEDVAEDLQTEWKDLPRHALEAIALEGYRSGALTESQVRRVLGFETRLEVNLFLGDHGIYYNYTPAEINQEIINNERLLERTGESQSR